MCDFGSYFRLLSQAITTSGLFTALEIEDSAL